MFPICSLLVGPVSIGFSYANHVTNFVTVCVGYSIPVPEKAAQAAQYVRTVLTWLKGELPAAVAACNGSNGGSSSSSCVPSSKEDVRLLIHQVGGVQCFSCIELQCLYLGQQ